MKQKTKLLKRINEEYNDHYKRLEASEEGRKTYYLMGLIIDHISKNYNNSDDKFIQEVLKYPDPLKSMYDVFCSYCDTDEIFKDVFTDFFVGSQKHRSALIDLYDKLYDFDDFNEEDDNDFEFTDEDNC